MSKKIPVANSPWGRNYERPSDCERWIKQGLAELIDGALNFTAKFFAMAKRQAAEADPTGYDDGTARRWVTRPSGGMPVKQLVEVAFVGTGAQVTKNPDKLTRPQYRRGPEDRRLARGFAILQANETAEELS